MLVLGQKAKTVLWCRKVRSSCNDCFFKI